MKNIASRAAFFFAPSANFSFPQPLVDHSRGASDTGIDAYRANRTIPGTGPAFNAGIPFGQASAVVDQAKNLMGTDFRTSPASDTFLLFQLQRNNISQVGKPFHFLSFISMSLSMSRFNASLAIHAAKLQ